MLLHGLLAGQQHRAGAVRDARGITGRDHAVLLEHGLKLGQLGHVHTARGLVHGELLRLAAGLDLQRRQLGVEPAGGLRLGPARLAAQPEGVAPRA